MRGAVGGVGVRGGEKGWVREGGRGGERGVIDEGVRGGERGG